MSSIPLLNFIKNSSFGRRIQIAELVIIYKKEIKYIQSTGIDVKEKAAYDNVLNKNMQRFQFLEFLVRIALM